MRIAATPIRRTSESYADSGRNAPTGPETLGWVSVPFPTDRGPRIEKHVRPSEGWPTEMGRDLS
jgi:hypothetical protein